MKIEKSNNPAAVGALVLVLVLIVGRILWMVFSHGGPVAVAATVPAGAPTPNAPTAAVTKAAPAPAPETIGESPAVTPVTTRNPFSVAARPAFAAPHPGGLPHRDARHRTAAGAGVVPLTSLLPFPVRVGPGASVKQVPALHALTALTPRRSVAQIQAEALLTLKLTATVGGTEPVAIVQTTEPEPVILHVGDSLDGMRVVAIHEQEVVFARGNGFWTLSLQSAADGIAADTAPKITLPTAPQPVISVEPSEEKTDDQ